MIKRNTVTKKDWISFIAVFAFLVLVLVLDQVIKPTNKLFMLLTVFYTAIGLAAGIVVDVSYGFIDPRIRMGSKK